MSTRIEGTGSAIPSVRTIHVEKVPSSRGDVYLVTTPTMRRVVSSWAAVLDIFTQSMQPERFRGEGIREWS